VTISCGDHNFPAHKLILSVCSPYFKNLFLRNPCKHPIVVLKDVQFKYMKLLLIFMYRGEVAVPQEDLNGLLKVARSLQVRGLAEMLSPNPVQISPRKRYLSEMMGDSDLDSNGEFSIDDVKTRLHGQLEIQAVSGGSPSSLPRTPPLSWSKYLPTPAHLDDLNPATRSSRSESAPSEEEPHSQYQQCKREVPDSWNAVDSGSEDVRESKRERERSGEDFHAVLKPEQADPKGKEYARLPKGDKGAPNSALLDAARAAGLEIPSSNSDPMSSISALLAAAQATGGMPPTTSTASTPPVSSQSSANQGLDLSNPAAAMANVNAQMQLYYYMQKLQNAGMGNPKERKECPICGKTLYDRSTWNRHMRIHTGEKPYPCRYCGRRFRTNYNKLGHEKKCPERHARALLQPATPESSTPVPNVVYR